MRFVLAPLAALAAMLTLATSAFAGAWATTVLDPLPDRLESGHSYTVGYWILQHGSHVSNPALTNPGLRLIDEQGSSVTVKGVPLPEGGHYASAIAIPHDGTWALWGTQAPWQDYQVGILTVPGRFVVAKPPIMANGTAPDPSWSTVKPPTVVGETLPPMKATQPDPAANTPAPPSTPWAPFGVGLLAGLTLAAGSYLLLLKRRSPLLTGAGGVS